MRIINRWKDVSKQTSPFKTYLPSYPLTPLQCYPAHRIVALVTQARVYWNRPVSLCKLSDQSLATLPYQESKGYLQQSQFIVHLLTPYLLGKAEDE